MDNTGPRKKRLKVPVTKVQSEREEKPDSGWRLAMYEVIFESDTPTGKLFDVALLVAIVVSVAVVMLDSVAAIRARFGTEFLIAEWVFTGLFTLEYVLRLISVRRPLHYAWSFFGVIDLLAIVPTYASFIVAGAQTLLVLRIFRLLRVFRVFKLTRYLGEAGSLLEALEASRPKITVFLGAVLTIVITMGGLMYLVEGPVHGFTSIPRSMYWAIVTLTTVGYGDIAPATITGQALASCIMILGYGIIAVPTGIVTVELANAANRDAGPECGNCKASGHHTDASYCRLCGSPLPVRIVENGKQGEPPA